MPAVNLVHTVSPATSFAVFATTSGSVSLVFVMSIRSGETFSSVLDGKYPPLVGPGVSFAFCDCSSESDSSLNGSVRSILPAAQATVSCLFS